MDHVRKTIKKCACTISAEVDVKRKRNRVSGLSICSFSSLVFNQKNQRNKINRTNLNGDTSLPKLLRFPDGAFLAAELGVGICCPVI